MSAFAKVGSGLCAAFKREPLGKVQTPESFRTAPKSLSSRSSIGMHKAATSKAFVCTAIILDTFAEPMESFYALAQEIPRRERSGFRLRAPASLTPCNRLELSPSG